jgi:phosphatidylglycerol---prolipoprotein diacylglyceryl transferase
MLVNNINPILFSIGDISIRYYGIIYALGFVFVYYYLRHVIKKGRLKISYDDLDQYILWLVISVVLMARLFEVFVYSLPYYINHLSDVFRIWDGGMSFHGGLIGAVVATYIFTKKHKLHFYDLADQVVIPTAFGLMLGRIANYTNSELYGTITTSESTPWCIVFQRIDTYCRHPTQLYESLKNMVIVIVLNAYEYHHKKTRYKTYKKGTLFWMFILLYGMLRFFITFFMVEQAYFGLNMGQWLCILMVIVAGYFLYRINHKSKSI